MKKILLLLLGVFLLQSPLWAETIYLKSGKQVSGKILGNMLAESGRQVQKMAGIKKPGRFENNPVHE